MHPVGIRPSGVPAGIAVEPAGDLAEARRAGDDRAAGERHLGAERGGWSGGFVDHPVDRRGDPVAGARLGQLGGTATEIGVGVDILAGRDATVEAVTAQANPQPGHVALVLGRRRGESGKVGGGAHLAPPGRDGSGGLLLLRCCSPCRQARMKKAAVGIQIP